MAKSWTSQQLDAMNTKDRDILVSAAAGSGKTAVLVERIVNTYYFSFGKPVAIIILLVYALDFSTSFYKAYEAKEQKENNAVTSEDEPELEYIK